MRFNWLQLRINQAGIFLNAKQGKPRPTLYDSEQLIQWWHCLGLFFRFRRNPYYDRFWGYQRDWHDGPIETFGLYWIDFWYSVQPEWLPKAGSDK